MKIENIKIGDVINGFEVTSEPYIPDNPLEDSAVDDEYITGEYIIPVDNVGAIYEHEI